MTHESQISCKISNLKWYFTSIIFLLGGGGGWVAYSLLKKIENYLFRDFIIYKTYYLLLKCCHEDMNEVGVLWFKEFCFLFASSTITEAHLTHSGRRAYIGLHVHLHGFANWPEKRSRKVGNENNRDWLGEGRLKGRRILLNLKMKMRSIPLKLPGRDGSWIGDYTTCGSCHLAHAARFALAPCLLQHYNNRRVNRTN